MDADKTRTTKSLTSQAIEYNTGPTLSLNRVYGSPTIGIGNTYVLSLRDTRTKSDQTDIAGKEIGVARVYDISLESGSYSASNTNTNEWDISLYDVQTTTVLSLNEAHTLNVPTFIEGKNSGATAFLAATVTAGAALTVYETTGTFLKDESLIFNGIQNGRVAVAVTEFNISNVKSVYATNNGVVGINTFCADVIQTTKFNVGIATISPASGSGSISTISSTNPLFPGTGDLIRKEDLIQYTDISSSAKDPIMARVTSVGSTNITIKGVADVTGVVNGTLPSSSVFTATDFKILETDYKSSSDRVLYTKLPKDNISDVDLTDASITIRKVNSTETIAANRISNQLTAGTNESFLPFDEERYAVVGSGGTTLEITSDKLVFGSGMTTLDIINLNVATDSDPVTVVTTLKKLKPTTKTKIKERVRNLLVDNSILAGSGIGTTTLQNGLIYTHGVNVSGVSSFPYGTRVEDRTISLNVPDVIKIHGIYEAANVSGGSAPDPSAPEMTLSNLTSASTTTSELIIGEQIVGQISNAIAIVAAKNDSASIQYIYQNENIFKEGEGVKFQESEVEGIITTLDTSSFDISQNYTFETGQENTFYDYGRIVRKIDADPPSKKIRIYFESAYYDATDTGDVTTVNSYNAFNYGNEIQSVDGVSNADIIDIRPRVSDYTTTENTRSPLEFHGRTFTQSGNSASNILASDEALVVDFSYYLGRIDRVFLTKDGKFQVVYGDPSENPERPLPIDDALEIAVVTLPPYLYNVDDAAVDFLDYKRYRMSDIQKLETRIRNLEYYTALSLLEVNTASLFVSDADGLNRFKSGFFVDNFETFNTQEESFGINNSIDRKNKELRPRHYTNSVDLMFGPVVNIDPTDDKRFVSPGGINVRRNGDVITLDYSETEYIKQQFGSRTESVTPFIVAYWNGVLKLTPESDTWVDTVRLKARIVIREGDFASTVARLASNSGFDPQTGLGPITWNSWNTIWSGQTFTRDTDQTRRRDIGGRGWSGDVTQRERLTIERGTRSRTGTRQLIQEDLTQRESLGDRSVSKVLVPFVRSRNIAFDAVQLKPLTRQYPFFDGKDVSAYCGPKLLEISMSEGSFQVGETVEGVIQTTGLGLNKQGTIPSITFRVAQINHKEGPYNIPTKTYTHNPYTLKNLPSTYSSTSDVLNIDTGSLADMTQGEYRGFVGNGMVLTGKTSGAQATINNLRLITDRSGFLGGFYFVPDPNNPNFPNFTIGRKILKLTSDPLNEQGATSQGEGDYTAKGWLETIQETIVATRNARLVTQNTSEAIAETRTLTGRTQWVDVDSTRRVTRRWNVGGDPLAQSFTIDESDKNGVFVTKFDVYFSTIDDNNLPVIASIRTMRNGVPDQQILPFSEVSLDPEEIVTSTDGSVATTFSFDAPVYLESGQEYALVLLSNSAKYAVYISRVGDNDLVDGTYIANQPLLGSLFKSQNASTWEPSQWEDLKYTLYRATFVESGTLSLYNPELTEGNKQIATLQPNSIVVNSRKVRVGLGTTLSDTGYVMGNTFYQEGTNATGDLVAVAGAAYTSLNIINAGLGYTPATGVYQFNGVVLDTITGNGKGATADVYIKDGVALAATVTTGVGATGYQVGDVLGITTIGLHSLGRNARFSVVSIGSTNELVLNNVQGNFKVSVGTANTMYYYKNSGAVGVATELNWSLGGDVQIRRVTEVNDGLHIKVNHKNHGMYYTKNNVKISDVESDVLPTKLTTAYDVGSVGNIAVDDATNFETFENISVGTTNYGYALIGEELISYESVSGNTLGVTTRGLDNTTKKTYPIGTRVYKYELAGVNLMKINKTHGLSTSTSTSPNATSLAVSEAINFDSYNIKLDMSQGGTTRNTDVGYPALYLDKTGSVGGAKIKATQNMPFELITPMVQNITVPSTTLSADIVTTTGRSISGNEVSYAQHDAEAISLNETNYLDSPRIIASKVNEDAFLPNVEGSKSLNMTLFLNTTDDKVSPVVDGQRSNVILTSNRINDVVKNYATDNRPTMVGTDPTACQYISREMVLENPGTSLKVLFGAHVHRDADVRVFYAINNKENVDPVFTPFPGYNNLNTKGQIIAPRDSDGLPDKFIEKSNSSGFDSQEVEFKDYTFTADQLPAFRSYRIKILMTSKNQVYVPRITGLRAIALA